MTRLMLIALTLLGVAAVASCAMGIDQMFMGDPGEQYANIILQGMKSAPQRPGDPPVNVAPQ